MSSVDTSRPKQNAGSSRGAARNRPKSAQAQEQRARPQSKATQTRQKPPAKTKADAPPTPYSERERTPRSRSTGDGRFERSTFVDREARSPRFETAQSNTRRIPSQSASPAPTYSAFDVPPPGMDDKAIVDRALAEVMKTDIGKEQIEWAKQQGILYDVREGGGGESHPTRPLIWLGRDQQFLSIAQAIVHEVEHQRDRRHPYFGDPGWGLVHYQNDYINSELNAQVADIHFTNQWAVHENRPEVAIGNNEGARAYWDAVIKTVGGTDFSSASDELLQKADTAGREALLEVVKTKRGQFHGEDSPMTYPERALQNLDLATRIRGTVMDHLRWGVEGVTNGISYALGRGGGGQ